MEGGHRDAGELPAWAAVPAIYMTATPGRTAVGASPPGSRIRKQQHRREGLLRTCGHLSHGHSPVQTPCSGRQSRANVTYDHPRSPLERTASDPLARQIHAALTHALPDGLTRTQLRDLLHRNPTTTQLDQALAALAHDGKATSHRVLTAGRPAELWTATCR